MDVLDGKISREQTHLSQSDIFSKEEFNLLFKLAPDIFCICDFRTLGYLYMSENVSDIMGYELSDYYVHGLKFSLSHFSEVHMPILLEKVFPEMFDYFNIYSEPGQLRFSYESMMKLADGTNKWFLHRLTTLETDHEKKPVLVSEYMSDIHSTKKDDIINVSVSLRNDKNTFDIIHYESIIPGKARIMLSDREREILQLISTGKSSIEIANELFISLHTVNNHRKNMLRKNNLRNTAELLVLAKATRLL